MTFINYFKKLNKNNPFFKTIILEIWLLLDKNFFYFAQLGFSKAK